MLEPSIVAATVAKNTNYTHQFVAGAGTPGLCPASWGNHSLIYPYFKIQTYRGLKKQQQLKKKQPTKKQTKKLNLPHPKQINPPNKQTNKPPLTKAPKQKNNPQTNKTHQTNKWKNSRYDLKHGCTATLLSWSVDVGKFCTTQPSTGAIKECKNFLSAMFIITGMHQNNGVNQHTSRCDVVCKIWLAAGQRL